MIKKNHILITIGLFTGVNIINAAIPFMLLPLLTQYLLPEEYIIIDIFQNICFFVTPIIGLNILKSIDRFYFDQDKIDFTKFVSTGIIFSFSTTLLLLFVFSVADFFTNLSFFDKFPSYLVYLSIVYVFFSLLMEAQLSLWRVQVKPLKYGALRILKTVIDLGLSMFFIVNLNWHWSGRIVGLVMGAIFAGLIAIYFLRSNGWIKASFSTNYLKEGLRFSTPLIIHTLAGFIIGFSDRIFILQMIGAKEAGIYAVAYQLGMVMSLLNSSFNQVWAPHTYKILKEGNKDGIINLMKGNYLYSISIFILLPIMLLVLPVVYEKLINIRYQVEINLVFWILLGYSFNGIYRVLVNFLNFSKHSRLIAINTTAAALLNLILNYLFISWLGIIGAAVATSFSFLLLLILTFISVINKHKLPWLLK